MCFNQKKIILTKLLKPNTTLGSAQLQNYMVRGGGSQFACFTKAAKPGRSGPVLCALP